MLMNKTRVRSMPPRGSALLASVLIAGFIGGALLLAQQKMLVLGMKATRHVALKDDVESMRRHILESLDCTTTLTEGMQVGGAAMGAIADPMTGDHCNLSSGARKLLLLRDRNHNSLTAPLVGAAGSIHGTGRLGDWVLLTECDRISSHSLAIRAARSIGNSFLEDPLTKRRYDFASEPLYLFGGPVDSPGGQRLCQDRLGGGVAPGTKGSIPRWETPTSFVPSILFEDPSSRFLGFNTTSPEVRFDFNLSNQLAKFRNDSGAAEISLEGARTGPGSNTASLEFINTTTGAWWHQSLRGDTANLEFHFRPSGTTGIENRTGNYPTVQIRFLAATGQIQTNGIVLTSDRRLKRDIVTLDEETIKRLGRLRGVSFRWAKEPDGERMLGFIAQEVAELFPDLVSQDEQGYYRVNYDGFIPVLVETVRRQEARLEVLEKRQRDLARRLERLETRP